MRFLLLAGYIFFFQVVIAKRTGVLNKPDTNFRSYNFTFTDMRHTYLHPDYFGPSTKMDLINLNDYNIRWDILKTFPTNTKSTVYTFEKNNRGEYLPSITVKETQCEGFRKQKQHQPVYGCLRFYELGFRDCPFKKGVYTLEKARCTPADGPIMAPGHIWRLNMTWSTEDNVLLSATLVDFTITYNNRPRHSLA